MRSLDDEFDAPAFESSAGDLPNMVEEKTEAESEVRTLEETRIARLPKSKVSLPSLSDAGDEVLPFPSLRMEHAGAWSKAYPSDVVKSRSNFDSESAGELRIRDQWAEDSVSNGNVQHRRFTRMVSCTSSPDEDETPKESYEGIFKPLISFPNTPRRMAWDVFGAALILWDLITIPMKVFDPPADVFSMTLDWICQIYWTANILATCTVGFPKNGIIIMSPLKILLNYSKSWLIIDLVVVVPDWIFTWMYFLGESSEDGGGSVRALRFIRLARTFRILRLLKLKRLIGVINDALDSEYLTILANIVKMIILLCAINHLIACLWFSCTKAGVSPTWTSVHNFEDHEVTWTEQYWVSFHWSITQFTPASMHVQPQNLLERVVAVFVVIFALVGFSYIVGSITGSLTQLRSMREEYSKQFWNLRRYMKKNNVPLALNFRIQRYLEHAWHKQQATVGMGSLKVLSLLSEQLNQELHCAISLPYLEIHPLFAYLQSEISSGGVEITLQRLAVKAFTRKLLARGDSLFLSGEAGTHTSFITVGRVQYKRGCDEDEHRLDLSKGYAWIAEPVLWASKWLHHGDLLSLSESELLMIDGNRFAETVSLNPAVRHYVASYAAAFIAWFNEQLPEDVSDITRPAGPDQTYSTEQMSRGSAIMRLQRGLRAGSKSF